MFDDLDAKPKSKEQILGQKLDEFSVAELEDYIAALEAEITRARSDIEKKRASADAAASIFKS